MNIKSYLVPQIFKITKRSSKLLRNIYPCIDEADNFIIEKLVASKNCFQLLQHFMQKHLYKCQRLIRLDLTSLRIGFKLSIIPHAGKRSQIPGDYYNHHIGK